MGFTDFKSAGRLPSPSAEGSTPSHSRQDSDASRYWLAGSATLAHVRAQLAEGAEGHEWRTCALPDCAPCILRRALAQDIRAGDIGPRVTA